MKVCTVLLLLQLIILSLPAVLCGPNEDHNSTRPFAEMAADRGYPAEIYTITTDDGYILQLFRMQAKGQKGMLSKPVVFCMHPLLASADIWVLNEEDKAPGYMLANAGYDVWFGNIRGNRYGRNHTQMNPDKDIEFWRFTWQHAAEHELPQMIEFVANFTGRNMAYVGHSQGTMMMFAALAEQNPIVQKYIKTFIMLGPVAYLRNANSPFVLGFLRGPAARIFKVFGINEVLPFSYGANKIFSTLCYYLPDFCRVAMIISSDMEPFLDNRNIMANVAGHAPAGTSALNLLHYGQMGNMQENKLMKFDFGAEDNMKEYGQPTPPVYNLKGIKQKIHLFAGTVDDLGDVKDVKQLLADLPDATYREYYMGHCTFLFGKDATEYMNEVIYLIESESESTPN